MFRDLWDDVPTSFKVLWGLSAVVGLTITIMLMTLLAKLIMAVPATFGG